jgi:predicted ferric reductase
MAAGTFILPGHPGGISTAHSKENLDHFIRQSGEFATHMKKIR